MDRETFPPLPLSPGKQTVFSFFWPLPARKEKGSLSGPSISTAASTNFVYTTGTSFLVYGSQHSSLLCQTIPLQTNAIQEFFNLVELRGLWCSVPFSRLQKNGGALFEQSKFAATPKSTNRAGHPKSLPLRRQGKTPGPPWFWVLLPKERDLVSLDETRRLLELHTGTSKNSNTKILASIFSRSYRREI